MQFCYRTFLTDPAKLLISDFEGKIRNFAFLTIFT